MIFQVNDEYKIYPTLTKFIILERRDRWEVNCEEETEANRTFWIGRLYDWLQTNFPSIKNQVFKAVDEAETLYIVKRPVKVILGTEVSEMV